MYQHFYLGIDATYICLLLTYFYKVLEKINYYLHEVMLSTNFAWPVNDSYYLMVVLSSMQLHI